MPHRCERKRKRGRRGERRRRRGEEGEERGEKRKGSVCRGKVQGIVSAAISSRCQVHDESV
eukprot:756977-Hanusia_phi.AAC.2